MTLLQMIFCRTDDMLRFAGVDIGSKNDGDGTIDVQTVPSTDMSEFLKRFDGRPDYRNINHVLKRNAGDISPVKRFVLFGFLRSYSGILP